LIPADYGDGPIGVEIRRRNVRGRGTIRDPMQPRLQEGS
jgi:hypothetical protein